MDKTTILHLTFVCLGAYFMPFISKRLMLPTAVGELFFGMVIGTFLLHGEILPATAPIKLLSALGFLLLMYIAGLELDVDKIISLKKSEVFAFVLYAFLMMGGSYIAAKVIGMPSFFALIIMTTAIGLLFSVLKDMDLVKTNLGQILILLGAIGEIMTLAGITIVSLVAKTGTPMEKLIQVGGVVGFLAVVIIVMKFLKLYLWWYPETKEFFMSVGNPSEIGIRANLCNMFAFVLIASFVGIEPILGAFLGGVIFARIFAEREEMLERLSGFGYGFLIPLFFIEVGTRFKLSDFINPEVLKGALLISLSILVVRFIATLAMFLTKLPRKQLIYVPFSQSFALTLLVAGASMGASIGLIDKTQTSIIILTAVVTAIIYPWIIKLLIKAVPVTE